MVNKPKSKTKRKKVVPKEMQKRIVTQNCTDKDFGKIINGSLVSIRPNTISIGGKNNFGYTIRVHGDKKIIVKIDDNGREEHIRNPYDEYGCFKTHKEAIEYFIEYLSKISDEAKDIMNDKSREVEELLY